MASGMSTQQSLFRSALTYLGETRGAGVRYVQIGAMDGVSFDEAAEFIRRFGWSGLSVEPIRTQFRKLVAGRLGNGNRFERAAIVERDGPVDMVEIDPAAVDAGLVQPCFAGMSAVWPPRNGLGKLHDREVVAAYGRRVTVPGLSLRSLFEKHQIGPDIDVFLVDAEGHDAAILRQLDLTWYRPLVIRIESVNLGTVELARVRRQLETHGYVWAERGQNLDAVAGHLFTRLAGTPGQTFAGALSGRAATTAVTALFDLGRGDLAPSFARPFREYLERFGELLHACADTPMVVHVGPEHEAFVREARRGSAGTDIQVRGVDFLRTWFPFFDRVQEIRTDARWRNQAPWLEESPQAALEFYNPLVMSKMFLLHDAVVLDPFGSDQFVWLDAGLTRTVPASYFSHDRVLDAMRPLLDRMLFVCFPYGPSPEVHGFEREALARFAGGQPVERVARGGFFGGSRDALSRFNVAYYELLEVSLREGLMGTEESLFSALTYSHADDIRVEMIGEDGLMGPFFARLASAAGTPPAPPPLALV